ncbi:MAG: hypothetical protein AAGJ18_19790 [Bacteroidota bacterium]
MNRIEKMLKAVLLFVGVFALQTSATAQCGTFAQASNPSQAEEFHVLYRQDVKNNPAAAFANWQKAYEAAPAADGARDFHFTDGIKIYKALLAKETDDAKKAEYKQKVIELYDAAISCMESGGVKLPKVSKEDRIAYYLGRKGYDMYYTLNMPYAENLDVLEKAVEAGGNKTEYSALDPLARIAVYQFQQGKIDAEKARAIYTKINDIADYNVDNNERLGSYYGQTKGAANGVFAAIETDIFDCEYFVEKLRPDYDDDPDNIENLKYFIITLKKQGCEPGSNEFLDELEAKYAKYAVEENAKRQAEFEANNPGVMANKLYKEGKFEEAIAKYREALDAETDDKKKAGYYFSVASIQGRKLGQNGQARTNAYNAAKLRPDWGRPYMLIGDLYAKSSRNCGNDGYSRGLAVIAAIDKYRKAKSVDAEVAEEANKKIGIYNGSIPAKEDVFMRGKQGGKDKVGCWIGETVNVRYN